MKRSNIFIAFLVFLTSLYTAGVASAYRDPETGTFLTRDPAGFVDGPNVYTYVTQNPWTYFDPLGLETKKELSSMKSEVLEVQSSAMKQWRKEGGDVPTLQFRSTRGMGRGYWSWLGGSAKQNKFMNETQGLIDNANSRIKRINKAEKNHNGMASVAHWMFGNANDAKIVEGGDFQLNDTNPKHDKFFSNPSPAGFGVDAALTLGGVGAIKYLKSSSFITRAASTTQSLGKGERIKMIVKNFGSINAQNADDALRQLNNIVDNVEDAYSGVKKMKNPGKAYGGRMYGPRSDSVTRNADGSITAKINKGTVQISANGKVSLSK